MVIDIKVIGITIISMDQEHIITLMVTYTKENGYMANNNKKASTFMHLILFIKDIGKLAINLDLVN